jgi:hypothetical protein
MFGKKKAKDAPPPGEPPAADSSGAGLDLSNLLTAFYEKHAPHKVKNVSNLLTHIEGGDLTVEELNQLLVDEYGEGFVPSVSEESSPNKNPPETELVADPEEQQSEPPPTDDSSSALKQLLTSFYLAHAPSKLDEPDKVDRVLEGFGDNIDDLNAALKREYGQDLDDFAAQGFVPQDEGPPSKPESQPPSASPAPAPAPKAAPAPTHTATTAAGDTDSQFKARLYVFYGQHAPDKVGNVETLAVQVGKSLLCQPCTPLSSFPWLSSSPPPPQQQPRPSSPPPPPPPRPPHLLQHHLHFMTNTTSSPPLPPQLLCSSPYGCAHTRSLSLFNCLISLQGMRRN